MGETAAAFAVREALEEGNVSAHVVAAEFENGSSLFDLMDLQEDLQDLLGVSVDAVSVGGLKDRDDHILAGGTRTGS